MQAFFKKHWWWIVATVYIVVMVLNFQLFQIKTEPDAIKCIAQKHAHTHVDPYTYKLYSDGTRLNECEKQAPGLYLNNYLTIEKPVAGYILQGIIIGVILLLLSKISLRSLKFNKQKTAETPETLVKVRYSLLRKYWLWLPILYLVVMLLQAQYIWKPSQKYIPSCNPRVNICPMGFPSNILKPPVLTESWSWSIPHLEKSFDNYNFTGVEVNLPNSYIFVYFYQALIIGILMFSIHKLIDYGITYRRTKDSRQAIKMYLSGALILIVIFVIWYLFAGISLPYERPCYPSGKLAVCNEYLN